MNTTELYILFGMLAVIALALATVLVAVRSLLSRGGQTDTGVVSAINLAIERFDGAVQHHTEVNAVLALTQQFRDDPELVASISRFSREVVGAALLLRVNAVGHDIKVLQEQLSRSRQADASSYSAFKGERTGELSTMLDQLHQELKAADEAVQQFNGVRLHVVT